MAMLSIQSVVALSISSKKAELFIHETYACARMDSFLLNAKQHNKEQSHPSYLRENIVDRRSGRVSQVRPVVHIQNVLEDHSLGHVEEERDIPLDREGVKFWPMTWCICIAP